MHLFAELSFFYSKSIYDNLKHALIDSPQIVHTYLKNSFAILQSASANTKVPYAEMKCVINNLCGDQSQGKENVNNNQDIPI